MRDASAQPADVAAEVAGTTVGDSLQVTVWRGGQVVAFDLDLAAWSLSWDATRQVQGQASFTIADPDGHLAPWSWDDPLAPGGSRAQLVYRFGASGITVPMGWWRLRKAEPVEQWRTYTTGQTLRRVPGGGAVTLQADEETASVLLDRLDPGKRIPAKTTVLAEIADLLDDYMAVQVLSGVSDLAVPTGLTYDEGRMDAIEDLLDMIAATHRMGGDRTMQIVPKVGTPGGWTIDGGDDGALINLGRTMDDTGVYNAIISEGRDAASMPLVGRAYLLTGPLAWGGDYGNVPMFHQAIANTQGGVQADATTYLATLQRAGEVVLTVECLTHPGIQLHDQLTVIAPTTAGGEPLIGRVTSMQMTSARSDAGTIPAKRMTLEVAVSSEALAAVGRRVARARI